MPAVFRIAFISLIVPFMFPIIASVLGVFLIIGLGAACRKLNWLTREADRSLTSVITRVLLPLYFVNNILSIGVSSAVTSPSVADGSAASRADATGDVSSLATLLAPLIPPLFGFAATAAGFWIAFLFARQLGPLVGMVTDSSQRAFAICVGICNYGYIPYPLAERFYPDAMIELILHNVGVELALWSIGLLIVSGGSAANADNSSESKFDPPWKRVLLSGPLLAVLVASMLRVTGAAPWIPDPVTFAVSSLAACAIPMGLLISGAIIVDYIDDLMRGPSTGSTLPVIGSAIAIRQLLMPVLMLGVAKFFTSGDSGGLLGDTHMPEVLMLQAAMPAAIFPIVLVQLYDQDTRTAIEVLVGTSVAAIVMIPVWLSIGAWWLG